MTQHFDKPMSLSFVMLEDGNNIKKDTHYSNIHELTIPIVDHSYTSSSPMSPSSSSSSGSSTIKYIEQYNKNDDINMKDDNDNDDDHGDDDDDENYFHSTINRIKMNNHSELTLLERRQRNKTASAKYRQKKNRQQTEMKKLIDILTENERLLKRQVMELRLENQQLKSMNDHLRGKIIAKKMLHRYIEKHNRDYRSNFKQSSSSTSSSSASATNCKNKDDSELIDKINHSSFEDTIQIFDETFDQDDTDSLDSF
ncbi:unnamed protein product [Cunninghamella blakesleeana]